MYVVNFSQIIFSIRQIVNNDIDNFNNMNEHLRVLNFVQVMNPIENLNKAKSSSLQRQYIHIFPLEYICVYIYV